MVSMEELIEAIKLAAGIMDYAKGDAWERECTAKDRDRFYEIYDRLTDKPVDNPKPDKPVATQTAKVLNCPECGKAFRNEKAVKNHLRNNPHNLTYEQSCAVFYRARCAINNSA